MKNWKTRLLFPFICSSESWAAPTLHKDPLVRETCFIRVYLTFPGMGSNSCAFGCSPCKTLDPGEPWSPLHYCTGQKKVGVWRMERIKWIQLGVERPWLLDGSLAAIPGSSPTPLQHHTARLPLAIFHSWGMCQKETMLATLGSWQNCTRRDPWCSHKKWPCSSDGLIAFDV